MAMTTSTTQLNCGRDIDDVWANIDRPPTAHEVTCPFCRAARADLSELAAATRRLRDDDNTDPDRQSTPAVLDRILTIARSEVRRGRRLPLDPPDPVEPDAPTTATISEQAVAAVIRRVADRNPDLQIRRCAITLDPAHTPTTPAGATTGAMTGGAAVLPADTAAPQPTRVEVSVSLRVSVGPYTSIPLATTELRPAIAQAVAAQIGLTVTSIDIAVEDLHDD